VIVLQRSVLLAGAAAGSGSSQARRRGLRPRTSPPDGATRGGRTSSSTLRHVVDDETRRSTGDGDESTSTGQPANTTSARHDADFRRASMRSATRPSGCITQPEPRTRRHEPQWRPRFLRGQLPQQRRDAVDRVRPQRRPQPASRGLRAVARRVSWHEVRVNSSGRPRLPGWLLRARREHYSLWPAMDKNGDIGSPTACRARRSSDIRATPARGDGSTRSARGRRRSSRAPPSTTRQPRAADWTRTRWRSTRTAARSERGLHPEARGLADHLVHAAELQPGKGRRGCLSTQSGSFPVECGDGTRVRAGRRVVRSAVDPGDLARRQREEVVLRWEAATKPSRSVSPDGNAWTDILHDDGRRHPDAERERTGRYVRMNGRARNDFGYSLWSSSLRS